MNTLNNALDLAAPRVLEAYGTDGDRLNFGDIYNAHSVTVRVPHFAGMLRGQTIRVRWAGPSHDYDTQIITVGTPGPIDFQIPRLEVIDTIGFNAKVRYTVRPSTNSPIVSSRTLTLRVDPQPIELSPPTVSANNTHVTVNYPDNQRGHTVRVRWSGVTVRETEIQVSTGGAMIFVIPTAWITENRGREVVVNYSISRGLPAERLLFSRVRRITL